VGHVQTDEVWSEDGDIADQDDTEVAEETMPLSDVCVPGKVIDRLELGVWLDHDIASEEFATLEVAGQDAAGESLTVVAALDVCAEDAPGIADDALEVVDVCEDAPGVADDTLEVVDVCDEPPDGTSCDAVTLVSDLLAVEATLDAVDDMCADDTGAEDTTEVVEGVKLGADDAACEG
jgi:hypothetical protein